MTRLPLLLLLGALLAPAARAQEVRPFPLELTSPAGEAELALAPDHGAIAALGDLRQVVLTGFPLPGGGAVDLALERVDVARRGFGFRVDGAPRPDLLAGLDLTVWRGQVQGRPGSVAMLGFSHYGSHGWIELDGEVVHLMARPDVATGDWLTGDVRVVTEETLNARGHVLEDLCALESLPQMQGEADPPPPTTGVGLGAGGCGLKECTIAIETDYQLFQVFNDLNAMTSYITTLLTFVSDRYETQASTVLTFPYMQFYTNSNDPWTSQDQGGSCTSVLYELQGAWAGNVPAGATIGHLISGADLGCGVAWLDVLCSNEFNFSVSGNVDGSVSFPVQQQPSNWDFIVITHELGHNFGSPHTHDYCPPLDQCAPPGYFGSCQSSQVCSSSGTIMSYCHLCSGGTGNITTFFHPTAAGVITNGALACLPDFGGSLQSTAPDILTPGVAAQVSAVPATTPQSGVQLLYRYDGGAFQTVQLAQSGSQWVGDLPPAACGDDPEFYFQYDDAACGTVTDPPGAPGQVFTAEVGVPTAVLADDFESVTGWSEVNLGATSGDWQRGVPVNDPGWEYDPAADFDGSGSAYLTQNQIGNTDVDNGAVRLISPQLDLTGGAAQISYAYYLRLTNQDGTDQLLVEMSDSGLPGPWSTVAVHDTNGATSWRTHTITAADIAAAGLTPGTDTRVRFTANDGDTQSIVEAGVDAFEASVVVCDDGPTAYCQPGNANSVSTGGAVLSHVSGQPGGVITFQVDGTPLQPGVLFFGSNQIDQPFGCGRRCVAGGVVRSGVYNPGSTSFQPVLDTTGIATTPFNVQYWYRDPAWSGVCGSSFNLSNALGF